jgi:hypothetical protein
MKKKLKKETNILKLPINYRGTFLEFSLGDFGGCLF